MSWRAAGCLLAGIGVFLAVTLFGMSLAFRGSEGCPALLQWDARSYEPAGEPTSEPAFTVQGEPVALGTTFVGLTTRAVFGPPGSRPSAAPGDRPDQIALDCGDGSFQTYVGARVLTPTSRTATASPA